MCQGNSKKTRRPKASKHGDGHDERSVEQLTGTAGERRDSDGETARAGAALGSWLLAWPLVTGDWQSRPGEVEVEGDERGPRAKKKGSQRRR